MKFKSNEEKEDIGFVHSGYGHYFDEPRLFADILLICLIVIVLGFVLYLAISDVDEITKADGKVIPSSKVQEIQSLDGGIVAEILIESGGYVHKNQALMKIDTTRFLASVEELKEERIKLLAQKVKLEKLIEYDYKQKSIPSLIFTGEIKKHKDIVKIETDVFFNSIEEFNSQIKILELQYKKKIQEKKEIEANIKQTKKTLELTSKELKLTIKMFKTGLKSKVEFLNIKKEFNNLQGELKGLELSLPRATYSVSEAYNKVLEKVQIFKSENYKKVQEIDIKLNKIQSKLVSESDKLDKTIVRSPVDGVIKQINLNTIGGVVKPGETLLEIVPNSETLLVEGKIDPKDIGFVYSTQKAIVKFTAYDYTKYGGLEGKIVEISADTIKDKESKDGKNYYKVVVKTNKNYLEKNNKKLQVLPGMITTVDIITGKKTILDFFLKPIVKVHES